MLMRIEKAGLKVQRDYMLRERRNSRIAVLVVTLLGAAIACGVFFVLRSCILNRG